jgi:hypothetical protein
MAPRKQLKKSLRKDTGKIVKAGKQTKKQAKQVVKTSKQISKSFKVISKALKSKGKKASKKIIPKKTPKDKRKTASDIPDTFQLRSIKQLQGKSPLQMLETMRKDAVKFDRLKLPNEYFVARYFGDQRFETKTFKNATLFAMALEGSDSGVGGRTEDEALKLLNGIEVVKVRNVGGSNVALEQEHKIQERRAENKARMESIRTEAKETFGATKQGRTKGFVELLNDALQERKELQAKVEAERKATKKRIAKQDSLIADLIKRLTAVEKKSKKKVAAKKPIKKAAKKVAAKKPIKKAAKKVAAKKPIKKAAKKVAAKKPIKKHKR